MIIPIANPYPVLPPLLDLLVPRKLFGVDRLSWVNVPLAKNGTYGLYSDLQNEVYTLDAIRAKGNARALKKARGAASLVGAVTS